MAKPRRLGAETSETRVRLLDVTERIMIDDGYAAVSSRRIAKDANVTPALVHYYFPTLDDLFLAVVRRRAEQQLERERRNVASPTPLRAMWESSRDPDRTGLLSELMALSNHRKIIQTELATYAEQFRKLQLDSLESKLELSGVDLHDVPVVSILVLIGGMAAALGLERALGIRTGVAETEALIARLLDQLDATVSADLP